jgi:Protein of unknown function (DUF2911)/Tetratricopeptide repeat
MILKWIASGIFCIGILSAEAQIKTPQPSPGQTLRQDFGVGTVEINYSRPGIKGRKLGVDIAPYGKVWRTGANSATLLSFSDSVTIGGQAIAPGKYGLLSIPGQNQWVLIITKQLDVTSAAAYKQENDLVRVPVNPIALKDPVETLTIQFANVKPTSMDLQLCWGNVAISLPITTDYDQKVMADIDRSLKDNRPYYQAGLYYMETGRDLNQAVIWFDKAIELTPKAYWIYHQKANALAKLGKKEEARKTAQKSLDLAKEGQNDDYVRLNEKLLETLK